MNYFERDCREISRAALQDPAVYINCAALVLLSIQQPFYQMPQQMLDVWENGRTSKWLFGHKRGGQGLGISPRTQGLCHGFARLNTTICQCERNIR